MALQSRIALGVGIVFAAIALWGWHAAGVLTTQLGVSYTWSDLINHEVIVVDRDKLIKFGGTGEKMFPEEDGVFLMRGSLPRLWLPNGLACLLAAGCGLGLIVSGLVDMRSAAKQQA